MLLTLGPFGGERPRVAPEHLPPGPVAGALRALDCKVYSGDLIPVRQSQTGPAAGVDAPSVIIGMYGASGTDVSDLRWLAWESATVDPVLAPSEAAAAGDRRVYWTTGDASVGPRWTTHDDAGATGGEPDADYPLTFPSMLAAPTAVDNPPPGTTGTTTSRAYVYTLVNSLGWESAPSQPSAALDARDGVRVDVTIPAIADAAANQWTHARIYRVLAGDATAVYRRVAQVSLGATTTAYQDTVPDSALGLELDTLTWTPLPGDAEGLTIAHNGIYAAFSRDVLHLSVPGRPWAWPIESRKDIPAPIVAIAATNNAIVVLTEEYPYLLTGDDPATMGVARIDTPYPCVAKRSVVPLGNAVVYASQAGLITIQDVTAAVPTSVVHDWDTWAAVRPDSLQGVWYKGRYLGVAQEEAFVFSPDGELISITLAATALWADLRQGRTFTALPKGAQDASAPIAWYDADAQLPKVFQWISKVFVTPRPYLYATLVVVAEYDGAPVLESMEWEMAQAHNLALIEAYEPLGGVGGPDRLRAAGDPPPTGPTSPEGEHAALGRTRVGGAPWEERFGYAVGQAADGRGVVRVLLYDRQPTALWAPLGTPQAEGLLAELWLNDRKPVRFRPPYRTDELVVVIESSARVRRAYVCEVPKELAAA